MQITDYDLTMNVEQDSQGDQCYVAVLCTPAIGCHQGRGKEPHLAIIALSQNIMQWDVNCCRKRGTPLFSEAVAKALNQPAGKWPFLEPDAPFELSPELKAIKERLKNIGRTVFYTPAGDDMDPGTDVLPAIITKEWTGRQMDLQVFHNKTSGTFARYGVEYSATDKPGTWRWEI